MLITPIMEFAERLHTILSHYELNASTFADRVEVNRSSISHLLSGRNKPSLEFVMNVLKQFPEVTLTWLVDGEGTFPATKNALSTSPPPKQKDMEPVKREIEKPVKKEVPVQAPSLFEEVEKPVSQKKHNDLKGKNITRVILFYDDGTFSSHLSDVP